MDNIATNVNTKSGICKGLRLLLIVQIIGITYSMLTRTVHFGIFDEWLKLVINVGILFCLSKLVSGHGFYRVPVAFLSIKVICTLLRLILGSNAIYPLVRDLFAENYIEVMTSVSGWVVWIFLICDTGGMLFEWIAHGKLVKPVNLRLNKYWRWLAVAALVVSIGMFLLNVFVPDMIRQGTLDVMKYQKILPLLNLPGLLVKIAYIVCLFRTELVLRYAQPDCGGTL